MLCLSSRLIIISTRAAYTIITWLYLAFSFLQVAKFFSAEFRDPRMSGKVCQQYNHEAPSCWGPHLQDGMKELLSVGIRSWHFMAIDMLSTVFMSIVHQQREVGEPYCNPKHTAMQWKKAVDKAQDESANQLSKHLGMQTFIGGRVYPRLFAEYCLRRLCLPHAGAILQPAGALSADSWVSESTPSHTPRCIPVRLTHCCDGHSTTGSCCRGRRASSPPKSHRRDGIHSVTGGSS